MDNREYEIAIELKNILMRTKKDEKHRGYHILPERLNSKIDSEELKNKYVFYEKERIVYMKSKIDFKNKTVLDIGCNMGYFLFEILDVHAKKVTGYEGKILCGEFLNRAIKLMNEKNRFHQITISKYNRSRWDVITFNNIFDCSYFFLFRHTQQMFIQIAFINYS